MVHLLRPWPLGSRLLSAKYTHLNAASSVGAATERGFPWLVVVGKILTGWIVTDLDATMIEAPSAKQGAAGTFKVTYGFHPLAGWCANTQESLAMLLRPRPRRGQHGG